MPSSLPPEILDHIVDDLHDEPTALKAFCVASKSWVSRTRRHLFAHIEFYQPGQFTLRSWMKVFPDPSNSPAHYTRSLTISDPTTLTGANVGPWIRSFCNIVHLGLNAVGWDAGQGTLLSLRGLSPALRSLSINYFTILPTEALDLICSFPSLEDLKLTFFAEGKPDRWDIPSASPKLTGSLDLAVGSMHGTRATVRNLLDLPGSLHFSKISVDCPVGDANLTTSLVSRCVDTLEFLRIGGRFFSCVLERVLPLDLSKALKLKDAEFWSNGPSVQWIATTLETAKAKNLRRITICPILDFGGPIGEAIRQEWQDLDRLLVDLWTSRSVRPKVAPVRYMMWERENSPEEFVASLLPELTSRGAVDAVLDRSMPDPSTLSPA